MSYEDTPDAWLNEDDRIVKEAKRRFKACVDWESTARINFEYDYKFANGDSLNMYQWDNWVVGDRVQNQRPCLTINKTMQHCLQIINDGKQNKPGVNIRPVGDTASFEAAQIFEELVRHIEYISNAETIYDSASEFQVLGGIGYWRLVTEHAVNDPKNGDMFEQEIYIRRIKDPRSVYLDPDINEIDGSDARFGFIFVDKPTDLYDAEYPNFKDIGGSAIFNTTADSWFTKNHVRVCEYFRRVDKPDDFIWFKMPESGEEVQGFKSKLPKEAVAMFKDIKKREGNLPIQERSYKERSVIRGDIEWYKIAGNTIIERNAWAGSYIPIIRIIGRETVIDGKLDRAGHVRPLLDPQRIYNINSSSNVEYGALQAKSPITAPSAAVEGYEEYYKTANTVNHSYIPYNNYDEDGNKLDRPERMAPPQPSPAYVEQMKIAQNEMMMVSGQYQAQMGENENAKSGVAINQRQRQGDRATFHFVDGQMIGIRNTGRQLLDLIPKIYDTKRVMRIEAKDGTIINLTIDPDAQQALQKNMPDPNVQAHDQVVEAIFNPSVGRYTVISDSGPSFATRRQEAFNALTQIAANNKEFMNIAGDILWKVADFPEAQVLAQRWRKIIPPNISGDAPNPQMTEAMNQAAQKIEQQLALITQQQKQLDDKDRELTIKEREVALKENVAGNESVIKQVQEIRADFDAISKRITALGNAGPAISLEAITPLIQQVIAEALKNGGELINIPGPHEGGTTLASLEPPKTNGEGNA
jgi:hypothetical protein